MSRMVATGYATPAGLYLRCGDGLRLVEPTRTPLVAQLVEVANEAVQDDTTPTEQPTPVFTWADENLGGHLDSSGRRYWNWSQPEQDWIRTGC